MCRIHPPTLKNKATENQIHCNLLRGQQTPRTMVMFPLCHPSTSPILTQLVQGSTKVQSSSLRRPSTSLPSSPPMNLTIWATPSSPCFAVAYLWVSLPWFTLYRPENPITWETLQLLNEIPVWHASWPIQRWEWGFASQFCMPSTLEYFCHARWHPLSQQIVPENVMFAFVMAQLL